MPRRGFQESAPQGGMAQFTAGAPPAATGVRPVDYSGIQQALAGFTAISMQRDAQRAEEQAAEAQRALGTEAIAEPTGFMLPNARRAFEERAAKTYLQQLGLDALRTDTQMRQQFRNDPNGYEAAWRLYAEETVKGLEESNPLLAAAASTLLAEQGAKTWSSLSNQAFDTELALQQGATVRQLDEGLDAYRDRLLDPGVDPDQRDLDFEDAVASLLEVLNEAVQDGRITPQIYNQRVANLEDTLRGEWVRGNVAAALAEGRHGDALGYVESLQQGAWFVDNDRARALASTIQSDITRALAGESDYVRGLEQAARAEARLISMGVDVPAEQQGAIDAFVNYGATSGSPEIQNKVLALQTDMFATRELQSIDRLGFEGLANLDRVIADPNLDPRIGDALFRAKNEREQQLNNALLTNDNYEILEQFPASMSRTEIAAAVNVDVAAIPLVRPSAVATAFELGKNTGNVEVVSQLAMQAIDDGGSAADVAVAAMAAADRGLLDMSQASAFALSAMTWASGQPNLANRIFMDGDFTTTDPLLAGINFTEDFNRNTELFQVVSALAGHDPQLRTAFRNTINNLYRAELSRVDVAASEMRDRDRVTLAQGLNREFQQIPIVEISGRSYPASWFGTPDQENERAQRARALNDRLKELSDVTAMMLRVMPEGDGSYTIYAGESMNIPVETFVPEETQNLHQQQRIETGIIQDRNAQESADPNFLREIAENNPVIASQASREAFGNRIDTAARRARINEEDFRRLAVAVLQSPATETASRFGPMAQNVLPGQLDPFSLDHSTLSEADAAAHFRDLLRTFNGDVDKATAAYWSNDLEIQYFVDTFGDAWLDNVPGNVREFVYRARNANVENAYQATEPLMELNRTPVLQQIFGGQ